MTRTGRCLAIALALSACGKAEETPVATPEYINAHNIRQLMEIVVQPPADVFWNSSGTIVNAAGEHDLTPTTDEGWFATQSAAATIAEMGNLLLMPQYSRGRGEDWSQFSRSLIEVGMMAEKAAVDRDAEALLETGGTIYSVCSACHQIYLPNAGD